MEAAQYSRPSLATDTGFLREFIEEYGCGFLYSYGDAANLARMLEKIAELAPDERQQLDASIRETARRHSWAAVIEQYIAVYRAYLSPQER